MTHEPAVPTAPTTAGLKPSPLAPVVKPSVPKTGTATTAPPRKGSLGWLWMLLLIAAVGGGYWWYRHAHAGGDPAAGKPGAGARSIPVVVSIARRGNMDIYLTGLGSVTALNTVTIRSRIDGQIDRIYFTEGEIVQQGQLLFQIDPRPYEVQLTQAKAQLAKDQANLDNANVDLKRDIQAKEAIPTQTLDTQRSLVKQLEAAKQIDEAQVTSAELNLKYTRIVAPISGRIGLRIIDVGNMIHASDPNGLAVINQLQPISVIFNLQEDNVPQIIQKTRPKRDSAFEFMLPQAIRRIINAPPPLLVQAYDRDLKNKIADGQLLAIDSQIDPTSGTVRLKGIFKNLDESLFPNQFVNARLLVDVRRDIVLVPTAAIQRSPTGNFVYVVEGLPELPKASKGNRPAGGQASGGATSKPASTALAAAPGAGGAKPPEGTIIMVPVTIGPTEGNDTVIETGLLAGGPTRQHAGTPTAPSTQPATTRPALPEVVVTDGVDKLQVNSKVIPRLNEDQTDDSGNRIDKKPDTTGTGEGKGQGKGDGRGSGNGQPHTAPSTEAAPHGTVP